MSTPCTGLRQCLEIPDFGCIDVWLHARLLLCIQGDEGSPITKGGVQSVCIVGTLGWVLVEACLCFSAFHPRGCDIGRALSILSEGMKHLLRCWSETGNV